ncbi:MAG: polysaccharide pyruvyl transferase CsaB [Fimbriimonadales bacterium]|nr:polysaccharide pyruvyl transferase CsaB [Fimbriimonadales bacterium]
MRTVIAGYYGYRNWGDEGSLATLLETLPRWSAGNRRSAEVYVLSADPAFTEAAYGVQAIPRMNLRMVRCAIRDSDALIFGGGSLLQDATSLRSLLYYLALMRWGLKAHGKVLLVGQGVGPLRRSISRWLVGATLRKVPFLSVRDSDSADLLRRLGVPHATLDADLTWALGAQPPHLELDAHSRWIGLAPRGWKDAPVQEAFTALCRQIHADGYRALLIPMQETQDRPLCERIASATEAEVLPPPAHPAQLLGIMRALHGMVAMRLHGAIFAASQGTPPLCVTYDPKVNALAAQLDAPLVPLDSIEQGLLSAWQTFAPQMDALRAPLMQRTHALRIAAQELRMRVQATLSGRKPLMDRETTAR